MKIIKIDTITIGLPFENPGPESSFAIADKNALKTLLIKICLLYTSPSPRD